MRASLLPCFIAAWLLYACGDDDDTPQADAGAEATQGDSGPADLADAAPDSGDHTGNDEPVIEQLLSPDQLPVSENGVYTDEGRFFVVGGPSLYEVLATDDGYEAVELLNEDCGLGGLVERGNLLYAVCVKSDEPGEGELFGAVTQVELLRVDPRGDGEPSVQRADIAADPPPQLNGMEFGPDGALYVSNSLSGFVGGAAIYRIVIASEEPLTIEVAPFLEGSADYVLPNGLRSDGELLYFAGGQTLVRMEVQEDATPGVPETIFEIEGSFLTSGVIDDFDLDDDHIYIARTDSPDATAAMNGDKDIDYTSSLVITDRDGGKARTFAMGFIPSSTAAPRAGLFDPEAVIVTSFFNGGLYQVCVPAL